MMWTRWVTYQTRHGFIHFSQNVQSAVTHRRDRHFVTSLKLARSLKLSTAQRRWVDLPRLYRTTRLVHQAASGALSTPLFSAPIVSKFARDSHVVLTASFPPASPPSFIPLSCNLHPPLAMTMLRPSLQRIRTKRQACGAWFDLQRLLSGCRKRHSYKADA